MSRGIAQTHQDDLEPLLKDLGERLGSPFDNKEYAWSLIRTLYEQRHCTNPPRRVEEDKKER